jgi:tetratricopeptide (TPR) repeat protein
MFRFSLLFFLLVFSLIPAYSQTAKETSNNNSKVGLLLIDAQKEALIGNIEKAITKYETIIQNYPDCGVAYFELANIGNNKGLVYQSISYLKKAYQIDSTNKWYVQALSQLYQVTGKYDSTTYLCERLIQMDPGNLDYYNNLASNYIYANNIKKSIDTYNRAEKQFGISEDIGLEKYKLLISINDTVQAIKEIEKLAKKFPKEQNYFSILAKLYHDRGNFKKAESYYLAIEKLNPADPYIHITLSDFYKERKNSKKAFEELKKGFSSKTLDSDFKLKIFEQYLNDTINPFLKPVDADELSDIIYQTHPTDLKAILVRGNSLFIHKKYDESKEYFAKALKIDSLNIYALDYYIRSHLILNDTTNLEPYLAKAIRQLPNNTYYFYFLGSIQFSKKEYVKVINTLQVGLMTANNSSLKEEMLLQLAEAYYYNKQDSLSTLYYQKVISLNPKNALALNNFSYHLLLENKNLLGALELAELAVKITPKNSNNLDTYAWALYKNQKYDEAKAAIKKAMKYGGKKNDVVLEHYGDILYKLDNISRANKFWIKALKHGPGSTLLKNKIKEKKLIE